MANFPPDGDPLPGHGHPQITAQCCLRPHAMVVYQRLTPWTLPVELTLAASIWPQSCRFTEVSPTWGGAPCTNGRGRGQHGRWTVYSLRNDINVEWCSYSAIIASTEIVLRSHNRKNIVNTTPYVRRYAVIRWRHIPLFVPSFCGAH